ncbi:hypothetical protein V6B08_09960 [Ferrovibrio sp. MS7]|jgi:ferric-dicitrate binding protein FerR (iron transport regulator)|nr:hypothetical protein [Ferrovibrio sp.]
MSQEKKPSQPPRRGRNIALALVLGGLAILFYLITIAKMTGPMLKGGAG